MSSGKKVQRIPGWAKLAATLILLAGLLLGGILTAPNASVQALNAPPQVTAPHSPASSGVDGTLASFTALFPQIFTVNLPFLVR
jgi:uncharacterized membrane protein